MARDPYRYFRVEAQELLDALGKSTLDLQGDPDPERVRRMLRQAHTLKGAARVVREVGIGDAAHVLEDLLTPFRESGGPAPPEVVDRALVVLDGIRARLATLAVPAPPGEAPPTPRPTGTPTPADDAPRTVRVTIADLDGLLEGILRTATALKTDTGGELADAGRELAELRERVTALRLVSADTLTHDLERAVRDAAREVGRAARLTVTGAETRIDAHVLAGLRTALGHVVRNAVAHGIEAPDAREVAGKPREGRITLKFERQGHRVRVTCSDDGRGLDLARIRELAIARGAPPDADEAEVMRRLLGGGLSTSRGVNLVAGRGIGLDVVREVAEQLNGEVEIHTVENQGTRLVLIVPVSLSSLPALAVEDHDTRALVPLDVVRRVVRLGPTDVSRVGNAERVQIDDDVLPYARLSALLFPGLHPASPTPTSTAVVIDTGAGSAAIGIDRVEAVSTVVLRTLPAGLDVAPIVGGAVLGEDGRPRLVLLPSALVDAARRATCGVVHDRAAPLPILVVDDSLTTRMLEQSILESAGYTVHLAVSGEDGLRRARERRYAMFLVDVEMPGIDGFEFVRQTRADPALSHIPAILITSRNAPADRLRGQEVGARGYVVKSEFDQQALLRSIRQLVG